MDAQTKAAYRAALQQATAELAGHERRGEALRATVEGLKGLLAVTEAEKPVRRRVARRAGATPQRKTRTRRRSAGEGHPEVSPGEFKAMGTTEGYRHFLSKYGDSYSVPQIRDALLAGGVRSKSSASLLTGLHGVISRDRKKAAKQETQAQTDQSESTADS